MADVSDEVISNMCKILRRDEAVPVSAIAEDSLKLGSFVARHYRTDFVEPYTKHIDKELNQQLP